MKAFRAVCDRCGASMTRFSSGDSRSFVCPYCGNTVFIEENDMVKVARLKSDAMVAPYAYDYLKHSDYLDSERRMFPARVGLIIGLACLVGVLLYLYLKP